MEWLSKEKFRYFPIYEGISFENISVIKNQWPALKAVKVIKENTVLGFDTESKPISKKGETRK
ncbi:hypothetical protein [Vibrio diazotrophicus]|uniref:hypothetical protein n=1 Tax=Vibrio diazotrophicus TaxID=685 RepID=UPI000C9DD862|nr:hypothetical protein [Vibrio diazotrophicus]PNH81256.1 hypothetical protein C1N27_06845 [Vibrio diazotrophicus]